MKNVKKITINLKTPYFVLAMFWKYKKVRWKHYNKRITTRNNENVQSHDQEESKLNSTTNADSGAHLLTDDKIMIKVINCNLMINDKTDDKSSFNKNNIATIKRK